MKYFIIEEGRFWDSILEVLKEKAASGVEVRVVYDDIGCMMTLPGDYFRTLRGFGIDAAPFSALKGNADSKFNNRSHRKITVIDGKIGYTGGVNVRKIPRTKHNYFPEYADDEPGILFPFGDGPALIYNRRVGKSVIQNMRNQADRYVYMISPHLIVDNELCQAIEDAALRGVDVPM